MQYFLDTEFIEDGKTIDLISIGIVAEDEREFCAYNLDCDHSKANDWVKENVLSYLPPKPDEPKPNSLWLNHKDIGQEILEFIYGQDYSPRPLPAPEFWAYYADYDWVAFCQLFGTMMDLPHGFPMYCRDLKQEADRLRVDLSELVPQFNEHDAIADARWNLSAFRCLRMCQKAQ